MKTISSKRTIAKSATAVAIITLIVSVIALGVSITAVVISINQYNQRYAADAKAADGVEFKISNNKSSASASITVSAGEGDYGFFQKSGPAPTNYVLKYKKTSDSSYKILRSEFTISKNNDYYGNYYFAYNKYATRYDLCLEKKNNLSKATSFEFDYSINAN